MEPPTDMGMDESEPEMEAEVCPAYHAPQMEAEAYPPHHAPAQLPQQPIGTEPEPEEDAFTEAVHEVAMASGCVGHQAQGMAPSGLLPKVSERRG